MAVRNKQVERNTALVKRRLQLPSSSTDVHLHRCRTKTDARRRLLFQSSRPATASFQWATRTQPHAHGHLNSAPVQHPAASCQQPGCTRHARLGWGRYHTLPNEGVLGPQESSRQVTHPMTGSYSTRLFSRELDAFGNDGEARERYGRVLKSFFIRPRSQGSPPLKVFFLNVAQFR